MFAELGVLLYNSGVTACGADVRLNCARDPPKPNRREQEIMTDKNLLGKQVRSDCPSILCALLEAALMAHGVVCLVCRS